MVVVKILRTDSRAACFALSRCSAPVIARADRSAVIFASMAKVISLVTNSITCEDFPAHKLVFAGRGNNESE